MLPATTAFYVLCAAAAIAGGRYVLAALGAAVIPLTAAALLVATGRSKTVGSHARRQEVDADADDATFPGIGMDDATPLGDTSEHSDAERVAQPDRRFGRGARHAR